jgi:hypothetical protein
MIIYIFGIFIITAGLIIVPGSQFLTTILAQEDSMTDSKMGNMTDSTMGNMTDSTMGNMTDSTMGNMTDSVDAENLEQSGTISRKG